MKKKKPKTKSAARKPAAKKAAAAKRPSATYTPKPLQGNGWAPFRYPPQ
jgi:hypothetical protein